MIMNPALCPQGPPGPQGLHGAHGAPGEGLPGSKVHPLMLHVVSLFKRVAVCASHQGTILGILNGHNHLMQ